MNAIVHVFEENFAREKCLEKSTSILCPEIDSCICLIVSFKASIMKEFFKQRVQMIHLNASLYYIAKLSKALKWLKIKLPLSSQICPVIDRHNFIKSCFTADIIVLSCFKLF